jgi:hypothetical protein
VVSFGGSGRQGLTASGIQGSAAGGEVQGSAELPPRPASWGRSISFMARPSDTSTADVAQEGALEASEHSQTNEHASLKLR